MPISDKINLYRNTVSDIYGIKPYTSRMSLALNHNKDKKMAASTSFVYNHKKYEHNMKRWESIIIAVKEYFDCDLIVVVPGHKVISNTLQKMFGEYITRVEEVEPRKYTRNHTEEQLKKEYAKTWVFKKEIPRGAKVLLLDDVSNTGTILNYFAKEIEDLGGRRTVIKCAQGMNMNKEEINKIELTGINIVIYKQGDEKEENSLSTFDIDRQNLTPEDWEIMKMEYMTGPYVSVNAYLRAKNIIQGYHRSGAIASHCKGWRAQRDEYIAETHEEIMEVYKKKQVNTAVNSLVEDLIDLDAFRDKLREMLPSIKGAKSLNHLSNVLEMVIDRHVGVEDLLGQHNKDEDEELKAFKDALGNVASKIWDDDEVVDKEKIAEEVAKDISGNS